MSDKCQEKCFPKTAKTNNFVTSKEMKNEEWLRQNRSLLGKKVLRDLKNKGI